MIGAAQCRCNDIVVQTDLSLGRARAQKIDIADDSDDDNGVNMHYVYGLRPCAPEFIAPGKTLLLWPFYSAEETLGNYQGSLLPIDESMTRSHHYRLHCYVHRTMSDYKLAAIFKHYLLSCIVFFIILF